MPRDFVPCVYHEREVEHPQTWATSVVCDVIELHQFCVLKTQAEDVLIGPDAHQITLRDEEVAFQDVPERLRAPLFVHFYAAMAALE